VIPFFFITLPPTLLSTLSLHDALPILVKRARRLATERDRLVQELAREWSRALKGQGFSARDLDELWAGLTEEAVRRLLQSEARRSEEHTSELQSRGQLVCRLLLEKKKK